MLRTNKEQQLDKHGEFFKDQKNCLYKNSVVVANVLLKNVFVFFKTYIKILLIFLFYPNIQKKVFSFSCMFCSFQIPILSEESLFLLSLGSIYLSIFSTVSPVSSFACSWSFFRKISFDLIGIKFRMIDLRI